MNLTNKTRIQLALSIAMGLIFVILVVLQPGSYALVGLFLIGLAIALLKKFELIKILLLLSTPLLYSVIGYLLSPLSIPFYTPLSAAPVFFGLVCAFLLKNVLRDWLEPSLRWVGFGIACILVVVSFFASTVTQSGGEFMTFFFQLFVLLPTSIILLGMVVGYWGTRKQDKNT